VSAPESVPHLGEQYLILSKIGAGGMGRVYLAHDTKHDRQVAIKVLDPEYARLVGIQRFVREIRIAAMLTHPNIVPLYDSGEVNGQLFYVMPYIEGESLRHRLQRETMLPIAQVIGWAAEVCDGLTFAHAHGIVHRDIKPENLLIQAERLLIADFGIARAIDLAAEENITSEQLVVGTPLYMSPEQASGSRVDARTDIYSLGCVLYEMLSGEPPFRGATPQAVTAKKLAGHYPDVRVVRPRVPSALDEVLSRALAPNPADRIATAEEFARSLRGAAKAKTRHLFRWLSALILVAGAIVLAVTNTTWKEEPQPSGRPRVVVSLFENRTGDSRHDPLGFMAADWLTEGLQRTDAVDVVPTPTAFAAARFLRSRADTVDPVRALARETGANLVVTGAIYSDHDSLVLQAAIANADSGRLVGAVEPLRTGQAQPIQAIQQLRTRVMGLLALSLDDRVLQGERPPTYAAYQAFSEGMDAYVRNDYGAAQASFEKAYVIDTTFVLPLLYTAFCLTNRRHYALADSVLGILATQRSRLNAHDRYWLDYQRAELNGNESEALAAIRRAAEAAPSSKATYNFAVRAFESRQPFAAESALHRLSPDVGSMRGSLSYWDVLTSALHVQGKHRLELKAAYEAQQRFPDRAATYRLVGRALAAGGKSAELERLWLGLHKRNATPGEIGTLAYDVGSELWAHGDATRSRQWFGRADSAFKASEGTRDSVESVWGRARAAARLGGLRQAFQLGEALAAHDTTRREFYLGFLGVLAVQLRNRGQAEAFLRQLAEDRRPYRFGEPQFQAGRIAAALRDLERATQLFVLALDRGYPYDLEFHRDQALVGLRGLPIMRQLEARRD
jgi:TolB-like protein